MAKVRLPSQSMGTRRRTPRSSSLRYAHTVPKMPNGTDTRNTSRQLIGASSPPSTSPMNTPLMPAMLLIPSARPRWFTGKASVRIAAELPMRHAAPMPCTTRKIINQIAPGAPVIQSMVSSSDATV